MAPPKRPWFRWYVEMPTDVKIRRLAPAERWLWSCVLGRARMSPVPGVLLITETVPMTVAEIADYAGMRERDVKVGLEKMDQLGLVRERGDGAWVVPKWDARQPESDDVTARTRKHRSKGRPPDPDPPPMERSIHVPPNGDGTFHASSKERSGNVDGTHQKLEQETEVLPSTQQQQTAVDGDPPGPAAAPSIIAHVVAVLMRTRRRYEAATRADNPPGWLRGTWAGIRSEVERALPPLVTEHPDWTFEQLAAAVDGKPIPAAEAGPPAPTECDRCAEHPGVYEDAPDHWAVCDHALAEAS